MKKTHQLRHPRKVRRSRSTGRKKGSAAAYVKPTRKSGNSCIPVLAALLLVLIVADQARAGETIPAMLCEESGQLPHLVLASSLGAIDIQLFEEAAPTTVRRLIRWIEGPIFNPALTDGETPREAPGFYDDLEFDFTKPHLEIVTSTRSPSSLFEFETELDARALGLDERRIASVEEAMDVAQFELHKEHSRLKKRGGAQGKLGEWMRMIYETGDAAFLVGTSWQEINEALGYRYRTGLASRPAVKGAVALWPSARDRATGRLTILLADHPKRTGRWMVIGQVTEGLEVAEAISLQPLIGSPDYRNRSFRPRNPVVIESAELVCRRSPQRSIP